MLGSSIQHNSTARGLASRESEFEALLTDPGAATSISRVSASEFAADDATALAACAEPFLVAGTLTGWRGSERWHSVETLLDAYGDLTFSLAHDVTVTLREYAEYARSTGADCPYYLVERRFEDGRAALLDDFAPPPPFSDDLFRYVPGSRSARYWFCGGPRSGTFLHADPLCTAAWNAVTCGAKRWCASHTLKRRGAHRTRTLAPARCFLPPETDLASLGLDVFRDGARQIASAWFVDELPRLRRLAAEGGVRMVEVVQRAGELVYIPAGSA